jgi:hypothetical protein
MNKDTIRAVNNLLQRLVVTEKQHVIIDIREPLLRGYETSASLSSIALGVKNFVMDGEREGQRKP